MSRPDLGLEPAAMEVDAAAVRARLGAPFTRDNLTVADLAALSQAISLRRIADALDTLGQGEGLHGLHGFVTNLAYEAGMNFGAGAQRGWS